MMRHDRSTHRIAVQEWSEAPVYPILIGPLALETVGYNHDESFDQIVPTRSATGTKGRSRQETRLDRRRRFRRHRSSTGAQARQCRNNVSPPRYPPYLSAAAVPGRHRCFVTLRDSGADPSARGETE